MAKTQDNILQFEKQDFEQQLRTLASSAQLASLINPVLQALQRNSSRPAQLNFFANTDNINRRIRFLTIPKKHGGVREIVAPKGEFRRILTALNIVLQTYEEPTPWAFGFVKRRSVVDNARLHVGKRYVLHIDLKDFFPSITRPMVENCLQSEPFGFSAEAVRLVAGLCTARINGSDVLAQGFATSPVLSNFIFREVDEKIALLAQRYGITYSRYADDLTFSTDSDVIRPTGEFVAQIQNIVEQHGFRMNDRKTHLQRRGKRQDVTGVIVGEKVNVPRAYVRELRNILYVWERYGYVEARKCFMRHYHRQHGATKSGFLLCRILQGKLNYLKMVRGADDELYKKLQNKFVYLKANKMSGNSKRSVNRGKNSVSSLGTVANPARNSGSQLIKWLFYIVLAILACLLFSIF